jgi:hypothetical protein
METLEGLHDNSHVEAGNLSSIFEFVNVYEVAKFRFYREIIVSNTMSLKIRQGTSTWS